MGITIAVISVLVLLFGMLIFNARRRMKSMEGVTASEKVTILTDQNFTNKTKSGMVLVDFFADWCMPCKLMVPVLNELAEEVDGKVTIGKLNVDEAKKTAASFKVRSIPTMILFKNGKEVHRFVGVKTKDHLLKELDRRAKLT